MSLATRCVKCGTAFRVVQDQLLVSEGWVRCGRCREVFNAIENMFDLRPTDAGLPLDDAKGTRPGALDALPTTPSPWDPKPPPAAAMPAPSVPSSHFGDNVSTQPTTGTWGSPLMRRGRRVSPTPLDAARDEPEPTADEPIPDDDPWQGRPANEVVRTSLWPDSASAPGHLPSAQAVDDMLASNGRDTMFEPYPSVPDFMVRAKKVSRWQHPRVRLALRLSALLLGFTLALQWAMHARDSLAARWPATESALQSLCIPFDCKVDSPRHLQALKVESASLTETNAPGQYRLHVALRNTDDWRVKMPALELQLTDARGETLARRVVTAHELGTTATALDGQAELALQGLVRTSLSNINGYNVTVFYP